MVAIAIVIAIVGGCSTTSPPQTEVLLSAFVYDVEPDPSDPHAHQLGLNVDGCNGDYEVSVDEAVNELVVEVLNYEPGGGDCSDSFTVHIDSPPHGKTVVDTSSGVSVQVTMEPAP